MPAELRQLIHAAARGFRSARRKRLDASSRRPAPALLLLRLPAQHLDPRARGQPRARRHRLPLHGAVDGPPYRRPSPRWAARACLDRPARRSPARRHIFAQSRRRHLFRTPASWRSARRRGRRQHHLQDPLQRRRGDDRRPAGRRRADRAERSAQIAAEGAKTDLSSSRDEPDEYQRRQRCPAASVSPSRRARRVQRELRETPGCTVMIYDQTCAAEKRRRRKRGDWPIREARLYQRRRSARAAATARCSRTASRSSRWRPNSAASARSTSRACNKDFSCLKGFCPCFVTVMAAARRAVSSQARSAARSTSGAGGAGAPHGTRLQHRRHRHRRHRRLTIGASSAWRRISRQGCMVLDITGLAQKGGAVMSHVRLAATPKSVAAQRIRRRRHRSAAR